MLDPCVGTGNYVVNIIGRIDLLDIDYKYDNEIFCNEVMLLPYYIASLNIEYAYKERTGHYRPFEGISFVDTLDIDLERHRTMFSEKNAARIARQQQAEITVIIRDNAKDGSVIASVLCVVGYASAVQEERGRRHTVTTPLLPR